MSVTAHQIVQQEIWRTLQDVDADLSPVMSGPFVTAATQRIVAALTDDPLAVLTMIGAERGGVFDDEFDEGTWKRAFLVPFGESDNEVASR